MIVFFSVQKKMILAILFHFRGNEARRFKKWNYHLQFMKIWENRRKNLLIDLIPAQSWFGMFSWYFLLYTVAVVHLLKITEKIGSFAKISIVLFPVQLLFFLYIFFVSVLKKILRREVIWKGRKIKLEK